MKINGKVALVTGSGQGIGKAIALALAREGARIVINDIAEERLQKAAAELEAANAQVLAVGADVTRPDQISRMVTQAVETFGTIDILINNAGINIPRPATDVTEQQWDQILDINLKGAFFCCQEVSRKMMERKQGKIINMASAAGLIPWQERAAYCSSKAGLVMLTRVLALEWAPYQITVNAVAPTFVETELAAQTLDRPGMRESITSQIPMGRLATLDDVTAAVLYLASPAADFVTGTVISVDGGLAMQGTKS